MGRDVESQHQATALLEEYEDLHVVASSSSSSTSSDDIYDEKSRSYAESRSRSLPSITAVIPLLKRGSRAILPFLVPSFLHTTILKTKRADEAPLHPTAYLDGLRGVAALIVVIFHLTLDWYPSLYDFVSFTFTVCTDKSAGAQVTMPKIHGARGFNCLWSDLSTRDVEWSP